ncbi:MAG: glycosyltransferase family 2 protein [Bacteroidia bacterium]
MLISLCIPTYNGSNYLEACLQSIYAQTFTDFEILICDDCSTDNTVAIAKEFQKKDSRIKIYINEKNLGLVGNWNRCIELATGEWIKFVFQDDLILPTCLQEMIAATNNSTNMVVCEREFIFEAGTSEEIIKSYDSVPRMYQLVRDKDVQRISAKQLCDLIRKYFPSNFIGEPTSIMFKKSIIEKIGFFNPLITQLCDLEYFLRIGILDGFVYIPAKLVSFRVHGSSTSQKNNTERYFTSVYSDRILLLCLLLYDLSYKNFRKNCTKKELSKLHYNLFYTVYHADLYIKTKDKDNILLKEMQTLKNLYLEINKYKKYYPLYATLKFCIRPIRMKLNSLIKKKK